MSEPTAHTWVIRTPQEAGVTPEMVQAGMEPTVGRWTTEPPTVPGWYWWRCEDLYGPRPVRTLGGKPSDKTFGEWYTIPIQEPPR